jgi:hypothetical protein
VKLPRWLSWIAEATVQQVVGAIAGSAVVTSLVSALVREFAILSWEWSWVLWTTTALVGYAVGIRTSPKWLPKLNAAGLTPTPVQSPRPTVEILEANRKERQAKREQLIAAWRGMVHAVHNEMHELALRGLSQPIAASLESHPEFLTLLPHLREGTRRAIYGRIALVAPENSSMDGALHAVLDDIAMIERDWALL